jgi:hypothetical protein
VLHFLKSAALDNLRSKKKHWCLVNGCALLPFSFRAVFFFILPFAVLSVNPLSHAGDFDFCHHVIIVSKPLQSALFLDGERCPLDGT